MEKLFYKYFLIILVLNIIGSNYTVNIKKVYAQYPSIFPTVDNCTNPVPPRFESQCCVLTTQCAAGCFEQYGTSGSCLGGKCFCTHPVDVTLPYPSSACAGWSTCDIQSPPYNNMCCKTRTCTCSASDPTCNPYEIDCADCGSPVGGICPVTNTGVPGGPTNTPKPPTPTPSVTLIPTITPSLYPSGTPTLTPSPSPSPSLIPTGSPIVVQIVAVAAPMSGPITDCMSIYNNSATPALWAEFSLFADTQVSPASWNVTAGGTYPIAPNSTDPAWAYRDVCWSYMNNPTAESDFITLNRSNLSIHPSANVYGFFAYSQGEAWLQSSGGGDVYALSNINSPILFESSLFYFHWTEEDGALIFSLTPTLQTDRLSSS